MQYVFNFTVYKLLFYFFLVPSVKNSLNQPHPPGLLLLEEFITAEEETQLIDCVTESNELDDKNNSKLILISNFINFQIVM